MNQPTLQQAIERFHHITAFETAIACALCIFATACGYWFATMAKKSDTATADFLGKLLAPFTTFIVLTTGAFVLKSLDITPIATVFLIKLSFAWFAIRLVMLLATQRIAGWFIALVIIPATILNLFGLWEPLASFLDEFSISFGKVTITLYQVLKTVFIVAALLRISKLINQISENRLKKFNSIASSNRILILKMCQIASYFVIFLVTLDLLGVNITTLAVFSGAIGVGVGFGLQKITSNFISGIILLLEKSIKIDDLVELSDGINGFVRHTGARYTLLETSQGKEILIPNEDFITQRVINWTYSNKKARIDLPLCVAYNTDFEHAKQLILAAASSHPNCSKSPAPACFLREFSDNGVKMLLQFWVDDVVEGTYGPQSEIMLSILRSFREHNIEIPLPQRSLHVAQPAVVTTR